MAAVDDVLLHWRLPVAAARVDAWALLADTDRLNRVAGLHHRYQEAAQPDGSVARRGHFSRMGVPLDWREEPFEWVAPERYGVLRTFDGGPALRYTVRLQLEQVPGTLRACVLDYTVRVTPRSAWTRPLVLAELAAFTRPSLQRTLTRAIAVLEGRLASFDLTPPPLSAKASQRLDEGLAAVDDPALRGRLRELLEHEAAAELREVAPLRLARRWGLPAAPVLRACLQAVRGGALTLHWSLRCPSCRVDKAEAPQLGAGPLPVHCGSCNIAFDGSLPDALIATMRPHPRIRDVDEPPRCIGSPARTSHVRASQLLEAGAELELVVPLLAGSYRLRTLPAAGSASLQVRADCQERSLAIDVDDRGVQPPLLRAAPGRVTLSLRNRSGRRVQLLLERVSDDPETLTVGRMLELPEALELLPAEAIAAGVQVSASAGVVLAVRLSRPQAATRAAVAKALRGYQPDALIERGDTVIAAFSDAAVAVEAASLVEGAAHLGSGLAAGALLTLRERDEALPLGQAVERALSLAVGGGELCARSDDAARSPLQPALAREGVRRSQRGPSAGADQAIRRAAAPASAAAGDDVSMPAHASAAEPPTEQLRIEAPLRSSPPLAERPPPPPPAPGELFAGRFRIAGALGSGGFGVVLRASDEAASGAPTVVKLLHPALAQDLGQLQRFYNEGRLAARVQSRYVAGVIDYGVDEEGRVYVASELLAGDDLAQRLLQGGALDPWLALHVARDVAFGLHDIHAARLVHRDVKPGNIVLVEPASAAAGVSGAATDPEPRPGARLIDFGIAKAEGEALALLAADAVVVGTPQYMAPEQATARPADGRADLFALGVVLFECLSGQLPFAGRGAWEQLTARLHDAPRRLSEVITAPTPPGVEALIAELLAREPESRPPSAAAVIARLEAALAAMAQDLAWRERPGVAASGPEALTLGPRDEAITTADTEPDVATSMATDQP